jgi:hypothetical protein
MLGRAGGGSADEGQHVAIEGVLEATVPARATTAGVDRRASWSVDVDDNTFGRSNCPPDSVCARPAAEPVLVP